MMTGANEILRAAGCALVGGHTSEGAELALGFAVNGLVARDSVLRKSGARPGDALILTKPIGTGTLLAANMRGKAKARWLMAAIAHMIQSNGPAAAILRRHDVHAATDVTGFGLWGISSRWCAPRMSMPRSPSIASRFWTALARRSPAACFLVPEHNALSGFAIRDPNEARGHPLYPLLFDPQTAGGLLASVPAADAEACVAALRSAGYAQATVIGSVSARTAEKEQVAIELASMVS